jgi:hypothetical protein
MVAYMGSPLGFGVVDRSPLSGDESDPVREQTGGAPETRSTAAILAHSAFGSKPPLWVSDSTISTWWKGKG